MDKIRKRRLTWFGHVVRMDDKRLPAKALYCHVEGTRSQGRQSKTWIDNVRQDLRELDMDMRTALDTGPDLGGGPWGPGPQASHQEKASHHLKYAILLFIMPLNLKAYFIKFILTYLLPYLVHVKMLSLVVVY